MKRLWPAALAASCLVSTLAIPAALAAQPQPIFSATVTVSPACDITTVGTYKNIKIDKVYGHWYLDGTTFNDLLFTSEAPSTSPYGGTLKSRTATFYAGPLMSTDTPHTVYVLLQFYSGGAHQGQVWAETSALCTRHPL